MAQALRAIFVAFTLALILPSGVAFAGDSTSAAATPVPEPTPLVLMAIVSMVMIGRRGKRKARGLSSM
jgi:hypothetical protein